jgi:hypothetical protein
MPSNLYVMHLFIQVLMLLAIAHLTVLMALFVHWLLLHALVWVILWLEEKGKKLALLLALFEQKLLLHMLVWVCSLGFVRGCNIQHSSDFLEYGSMGVID